MGAVWTQTDRENAEFNENDNIAYWLLSGTREECLIRELQIARAAEVFADKAELRSESVVATRRARVALVEERLEAMLTARRELWF